MPIIFDCDDRTYHEWLVRNPCGYVINARWSLLPSYRVLHRATCWTIQDRDNKLTDGAFTERNYIKVCAEDIQELRDWLRRTGRPDGLPSKECSLCT